MTYSILSAVAEYSEPGVVKMLYCENVTFGRYTAIIILSYYTITFILCQWIEKAKNKIIYYIFRNTKPLIYRYCKIRICMI